MIKKFYDYTIRKTADLIPYAKNSRTHSDLQVRQIAGSIREWGFTNPVLIDEKSMIIAGHGRVMAAAVVGLDEVPCVVLTGLTDTQKQAYIIADNKLALNAGWDEQLLALELKDLEAAGFDINLTGFDHDELDALGKIADEGINALGGTPEPPKRKLTDMFMIAPFSVFNAREGWWQDRKSAWLNLGIQSEVGRGDNMLGFSEMAKIPVRKNGSGKAFGKGLTSGTGSYAKSVEEKSKFGKCLETGIGEKYGREEMNGTSIFDPVVCEIAYRWFSPVSGRVLDPFAGGSVRGIVAAKLGRAYTGVDLRLEQVEANKLQGEALIDDPVLRPDWRCADSANIVELLGAQRFDFLFSCPPYADLEVYSEEAGDISNMDYPAFKAAYFDIIKKSCTLLRDDRFACFVVGEVRGKGGNGAYHNFVGDTIQAFQEAGLDYYNEAILVTAVGSLPIRVGRQFSVGRKLGKTHQNILVFVKGNARKAVEACGTVEVDETLFAQLEAKDEVYGEKL